MTTTIGAAILLAQASLGFGGHHARPAVGCCDVCGVETAQVTSLIVTLQTCPNWRKRDNAAHALRKYDWQCHPEIPAVLANSLLLDCHEEVREESAESLAKLAPCLPEVHAALLKASRCDPDHATRREARKALDRLEDRCVAACSVCGPVVVDAPPPVEIVQPLPTIYYGRPVGSYPGPSTYESYRVDPRSNFAPRYIPEDRPVIESVPVEPGYVPGGQPEAPSLVPPAIAPSSEGGSSPATDLPPLTPEPSPFGPQGINRDSKAKTTRDASTLAGAKTAKEREEELAREERESSSERRPSLLRAVFGRRR